jgi:hypothetical protein
MATINPPWRFDPLQMPVNINWRTKKYLLYVVFDWGDKVITFLPDASLTPPEVISEVGMSITNDAPSGMLVYDNTVTTVNTWQPGVFNNLYFRSMVFEVGSFSADPHPFAIRFTLTDQGIDTADYNPFILPDVGTTTLHTTDSRSEGCYLLSAGGPWPTVSISLYDAAIYEVNSSDPLNVIKAKDPHHDPGRSSATHFLATRTFTAPSTDQGYYSGLPDPLISGGFYSSGGLFVDGWLELSMANIAGSTGPAPCVWPSAPSMFTVDYVFGFPLTFLGANGIPNPPPAYNFGVYTITPNPSGAVAYQSGGPPIPENSYTGTYPPP